MKRICLSATLFVCFAITGFAQTAATIPTIIEKNGRHALLVDGQPFFVLGGQAHNSSAWPSMLPQLWSAIEKMNANTLEVPVYWEQVEPQPGKFDFSLVDTLIRQSIDHKVRIVLLWFATWKNGSNHYMPGWMKKQAATYPNITGSKGQPIDSPSPHSKATLEADTKAFVALMKYLKQKDPLHRVIMVQVENEPGAWDTVRDYSPAAQQLFEGPVPAALLQPDVLKALNRPVGATGNWKEVFGKDADEYFHAWSVAHFIGQVAAAGKAVYPLPLYTNAALRDPLSNPPPTSYESGGPTDNVIPIWKAAAPALVLLVPDIYLTGSERVLKVLELYNRADNALFVPEIGFNKINAKYLYPLMAAGGIGFAPFGIDDNGTGIADTSIANRMAPYTDAYAAMAPMIKELAQWSFEGKIKAVVEREDHGDQTIDLGAWQAMVSFGGEGRGNQAPKNNQPTGKIMIVQLSENQFLVMGTLCHITFIPAGNNNGKPWQFDKVEEGIYNKGIFTLQRILNGDETDWGGPRFGATPVVLRISLVAR